MQKNIMKDELSYFIHDQVTLLEILQNNMVPLRDILIDGNENSVDTGQEYLPERLKDKINIIIKANESFILTLEDKSIKGDRYEYICGFNESMREYSTPGAILNPTFIYDKLKRLEKVLISFKSDPIPNSAFRQILDQIRYVIKILATYFWHHSNFLINNLIERYKDFDEFINNDERNQEMLPFELISCVEMAIRNYQIKYNSKKLGIERYYKVEKSIVVANRPSILRSLENVFHNCVKYNRTLKNNRVWITITIYEDHQYAIIEFQNWGVGILDYEIDLVFSNGYRGELAKTNKIDGSGLGLSYAKREIEKANGEISIKSKIIDKLGPGNLDQNYLTTTTIKLLKKSHHTKEVDSNAIIPYEP